MVDNKKYNPIIISTSELNNNQIHDLHVSSLINHNYKYLLNLKLFIRKDYFRDFLLIRDLDKFVKFVEKNKK
jgi:hypothetical protein